MPRFFFDVYDGVAVPDSTGQLLEDVRCARHEAARRAAEVLLVAPERLWRDGDWTVWVRDETGLQLFSVIVLGMFAPASMDGRSGRDSTIC